jgi:hypothetical protein
MFYYIRKHLSSLGEHWAITQGYKDRYFEMLPKPLIAQMVERKTVVVKISLGPEFDSQSADFIIPWNYKII